MMTIERRYREVNAVEFHIWVYQFRHLCSLAQFMARMAVTRRGIDWHTVPELQ